MNQWIKDVQEFQAKFEPRGDWNGFGAFDREELLRLRKRLVNEENGEFNAALTALRVANEKHDTEAIKKERIELLDAICDSIYVLIGTATKLNMDLEGAFAEVQRSNMSKLFRDGTVHRDEGGKVQKGEDFSAPNLEQYI